MTPTVGDVDVVTPEDGTEPPRRGERSLPPELTG